ncbi:MULTISPECIES: hypothetical protein [unclassified Carboxylicivirga]|uniref:hypothetical protein n=1 Tax=Carboxylicivirga TaxID=1628153 RepID=UPI003D329CC4
MNLFKNLFLLALSVVVLASCNDDDNNAATSKVKVAVKTVKTSSPGLKAAGESAEDPFQLEVFMMSIGEIEFDVNDDMEDVIPGGDSIYSDIDFEGPFLVDILSPDAETGIDLAAANVPNAVYEEIEFDFEPYDKEEPAAMAGNTLIASGTYDGTPFSIVSDEEVELELEFPNGYSLEGADSRLFIELYLTQLIDLVKAIDFTNVELVDGVILINKDHNKDILDQFEEAVENCLDMEEEGDDDDDNDDE